VLDEAEGSLMMRAGWVVVEETQVEQAGTLSLVSRRPAGRGEAGSESARQQSMSDSGAGSC
jgi:hypothetical protein